MLGTEKRQLLNRLDDYYESRDKIVLTANEYALIFRIIDENPDKNARELIPILTSEIDKYRKEYMIFLDS